MKLIDTAKGSAICYADNVFDCVLCDEIISRFDSSKDTVPGAMSHGNVDLNTKMATDLPIAGEEWEDINLRLIPPFTAALEEYALRFPEVKGMVKWRSKFLMMKYEQGSGYFNWHSDSSYSDGANKVLSIIIYLNSVEKGGETEFRDHGVSVSPVVGRMVIFPSNWTHIHRSTVPLSGPKFIINCFMGN